MVKRAKSPDTAEDEKYFTIYQPYPLNANWELSDDYIAFSRWMAGCIGTAPLHALHYKPKARGMVLLEIDKKYPHNDRLLGEHRWSEFLRSPSEEEQGRVSQIFHSLYTTGREAQKDGWKRIHVESSWFKDWSPDNVVIQNPYPVTHWCSTPPEDRTNKPLCRPLPNAVKPPPPVMRVVPPVVGSAAWASKKAAPPQNTPPVLKSAWDAKQKAVATAAAPAAPATPAAQLQNTPPVLKGAWASKQKAVAAAAGPASPAAQPQPTPIVPVRETPPHMQSANFGSKKPSVNAWNTPITQKKPNPPQPATTLPNHAPSLGKTQAPAYPPGLGPRVISSGAAIPPALIHSPDSDSSRSSFGSGSQFSSDGLAIKTLANRLEETVSITLSPSQDRALNKEALDPILDLSPDLDTTTLQPWERAHLETVTYIAPVADAGGDDVDNLWAAEEEKFKLKPVPPEMPNCPVHGIICKKGICKEMSKIVKERERAQKEQERKNSRGKGRNGGRGNWNKNGGGGGWKRGSSNEDTSTTADDDGFSPVTARGRDGTNRNGNTWRKNRDREDDASSAGGGGTGLNRANSVSSNSGSAAARSETGWTNASRWD